MEKDPIIPRLDQKTGKICLGGKMDKIETIKASHAHRGERGNRERERDRAKNITT